MLPPTRSAAMPRTAPCEVRIERDAGEVALIGFDISAIPTSAIVSSATLTVTHTQISSPPLPIEIHRVLKPWGQGTQSGSSGVANFTTRQSATAWTNPGAAYRIRRLPRSGSSRPQWDGR